MAHEGLTPATVDDPLVTQQPASHQQRKEHSAMQWTEEQDAHRGGEGGKTAGAGAGLSEISRLSLAVKRRDGPGEHRTNKGRTGSARKDIPCAGLLVAAAAVKIRQDRHRYTRVAREAQGAAKASRPATQRRTCPKQAGTHIAYQQ
jgi:hypothetical protein